MSQRKRQSKKKLKEQERITDAKRWMMSGRSLSKSLLKAYSRRYAVSEETACLELMGLGYYDEICIQNYESKGIEWEFRVEGRSGDMFVVPKDSEEHEI